MRTKRFSKEAKSAVGAVLAALLLGATPAAAATVYVSNAGFDLPNCGSAASPCRSIGKAIDNSAVGGSIVVGPGVYGDIDQDGTLGESGEEQETLCGMFSTCMLPISKQVVITSSAGAYATVITTGAATVDAAAYLLDAVTLGAPGKGFTVKGESGVWVLSGVTGATIAGNIITPLATGVGISDAGNATQILSNRIVGGYFGMYIGSTFSSGQQVVRGNTITGAILGFYTSDPIAEFSSNVVAGNEEGVGASVALDIVKSSIIGNANYGALLSGGSITSSNIYGNGNSGGMYANCGVYDIAATGSFSGNWWGAATGPGTDPADTICNAPLTSGEPYLTAPLKVKVKGIR